MKKAQVRVRYAGRWMEYGQPRAYVDALDLAAALIAAGVVAAVTW